jgi:N-acyl amino acid synthase of PEP-CTERM/exosortase system
MFTLHLADTKALRESVYHIRYQVYCEEKGIEHTNSQQVESDRYDEFSQHVLIEHNRTGIYAGCARLVLPPKNQPPLSLPYAKDHLDNVDLNRISPLSQIHGDFGEISKVVVLPNFRRKAQKRSTNNKQPLNPQFSAQERIAFAHINLALIIASLSLARLNQLDGVFIFTDKRMSDYLKRIGLALEQVGDPFSYQGIKSLFYLDKVNFTNSLGPDLTALFSHTHEGLISKLNDG